MIAKDQEFQRGWSSIPQKGEWKMADLSTCWCLDPHDSSRFDLHGTSTSGRLGRARDVGDAGGALTSALIEAMEQIDLADQHQAVIGQEGQAVMGLAV